VGIGSLESVNGCKATVGFAWELGPVSGDVTLQAHSTHFTSASHPGGFDFLDHLAKLPQCDVLNLPDALAGHSELLANFLQRFLRPAVQPEAETQDRGFARVQFLDHLLKHPGYGL